MTRMTYAGAGVDIDAGDALVDRIGPLAAATGRPGVLGGLGGFGALFDLRAAGFVDPILVASTDGVGTKLRLAIDAGRHATVGIDLVAMCVNDLVVQGAEPLFFLDYFATARLDVGRAASVVAGIAEGCRLSGCALVGGETAEMPGMYAGEDYDLAGFAVGAAERGRLLPAGVAPGCAILGLPSSGPHSNGFSLVRRVLAETGADLFAPAPFDAARQLDQVLLEPTRLYVRPVLALHRAGLLRAAAHVTGGGLPGNLPRALSDGMRAVLDPTAWSPAPVFGWLAGAGIATEEMLRVFNCGIGMALVVDDPMAALALLAAQGTPATVIGRVEAAEGAPEVRFATPARLVRVRRRVGILIGGRGSNMAALIAATHAPGFPAGIALVLSHRADAPGLVVAREKGVATAVVEASVFGRDRGAHEAAIAEALDAAGVEVVCLAGWMRLLTPLLVERYAGRMLNVHPSLLPAFPGLDTHRRALAAGVTVHGCTVHIVTQAMDEGPILAQAAVPVLPSDTEASLAARVLRQEHALYPATLARFVSGRAGRAPDDAAVLCNPLPPPPPLA